MYHVGDKVVYPMHGAGVVEAIEEKEILGDKRKYYILKFPLGGMKVMVPVNSATDVGIREIMNCQECNKVIKLLNGAETEMPENWNHRYRANMDKIKSGDVFALADVVRNLILRDKEKGLSTGERKMLNNAKQILVSEMLLSGIVEEDEIEKIFDGISGDSV